jgi:hypothetical protein
MENFNKDSRMDWDNFLSNINNAGSVHTNVILRRVRETVIALEKLINIAHFVCVCV